MEYQSLSEQI